MPYLVSSVEDERMTANEVEDVVCLAPHFLELTNSATLLLHSAPQLVGHPGCSRDDEVVEADVTVDHLVSESGGVFVIQCCDEQRKN